VTVTELVVGLENEPGRLSAVVEALGRAGVTVVSLSVAGSGYLGQARIFTDDHRRARTVLMALDVPAHTEEAIVVETPAAGSRMVGLLDPLSREGVNITHLQSFPVVGESVIVSLCSSNTALTVGVLQEHGFKLLDHSQLMVRLRGAG